MNLTQYLYLNILNFANIVKLEYENLGDMLFVIFYYFLNID